MSGWNRTMETLTGAVLEPETTWDSFAASRPDWRETTLSVAGPMIVIAAVLTPVIGWIFGANLLPGLGGFLFQILFMLVGGLVVLFLSGAIFGLIAGSFGGRNSFDSGFAAVTLASVPAYAGQIVSPLPWIGWLIALILSIYSLVLLYRNLPVFLAVPQDKRVGHFVVGLVILIVVWAVISAPMAGLIMPGAHGGI